ncbi:lysine decarboxylation/transport transcriptional activator CadC [Vibrio vulnificus]|uniref:lysine decarboxylation/transport transcriptional activator CadC n=1 Tax=Vibrio vulnificus TaxID=672 RepID=UPI0007351211|nr:lysine decarboxylation/transport transcriptional activator CadC [Vibrio vulnificus]EID0059751.1 lysine decarboxylation/transport transcriptional activator CadC [Vibrio vulnificus]EID0715156.1 lysine decarboxylation/transport transcriptional activator CadC [Vibrio vulnificus]EID0739329.1 lysine decarboxylation/transport transcriptional activator CadC [Vibrio vulnificus]EJL7816829.1 lysine decarboxylation/transport transcriptional activator CadC [Vibrio vulnificus]ELK2035111.1 lysine decarbox
MIGIYFQINDWVLCIDENKLYRQDREVSVEPRLINLLHFLAEHVGEVFGREELIQHVWDGAIVTDQVVTQSIFELRKLLRDGREENLSYVVTVPKRGYKLVANVERLTANPYLLRQAEPAEVDLLEPTITEPSIAAPEAEAPSANEMVFPAGPLTRAMCQSQQQKKPKRPNISRWRVNAFNALWIGLVIIAMGFFTIKQSQVRITQVVDTHLIEFMFQDDYHAQALSHDLADGIAQKLMADITQVTDYRVMLSKTAFTSGILPGKSIMVRVSDKDGHAFIELELKNNSSGAVLFSRQYPLDTSHLSSVLHRAEVDIMQALRLPNAEQQAQILLVDFPKQPAALALYVRANHYLNLSDRQQVQKGIDLLEQVLNLEPNNHYVQAELLIAYHVQQALSDMPTLNQERILLLSSKLQNASDALDAVVQPRIYEALALEATVDEDLPSAERYLAKAQQLRESVLSYVLQGKHAELRGDLDGASDGYSEAFYMDTSLETYLLCERLVFQSNLKSIDYAMYRSVHPSVVRLM